MCSDIKLKHQTPFVRLRLQAFVMARSAERKILLIVSFDVVSLCAALMLSQTVHIH